MTHDDRFGIDEGIIALENELLIHTKQKAVRSASALGQTVAIY